MKVSLERTLRFDAPSCMTLVVEGRVVAPYTVNYTLPGTGPYRLHASVNLPNEEAMCYAFPLNMTGNTLTWTPELRDRMAPRAEGDESDLRVHISPGTSVIWIASEIPKDGNMTAETNVYVSENFTVMTDEMANDHIHGPENGALNLSPKLLSLKGVLVAALLGAGLMTL